MPTHEQGNPLGRGQGESGGSARNGNEFSGPVEHDEGPARPWTREEMDRAEPYPLPEIPADDEQD